MEIQKHSHSGSELVKQGQSIKAIDLRRENAQNSEIMSKLSQYESKIYIASTKWQIRDIKDVNKFIIKISELITSISYDIGFNIPQKEEFFAICTRLSEYLIEHKPNLSFSEFQLAFEMLITGELDGHLEDKNHYQRFNLDYVIRVLTAYEDKRFGVFKKVRNIVEKIDNSKTEKRSEEEKIKDHNTTLGYVKAIYEGFLLSDNLELSIIESQFVSSWMVRVGLLKGVNVSEKDKNDAFSKMMLDGFTGHISEWRFKSIKNVGKNSKDLTSNAHVIARNKEILRVFIEMKSKKEDITKYLDYR